MTADGGDPFQLTYGEFDATAPRWSPDGRRIAYISNESGNTSLWIVDVPGGARQRGPGQSAGVYRSPVGRAAVTVVDGHAAAARVSVTGPRRPELRARRRLAPRRRRLRPRASAGSSTATSTRGGRSALTLPAGRVRRRGLARPGLAGRAARRSPLPPAATPTLRVALRAARRPAGRGLVSGDLHVHMNYGGTYRNTPRTLAPRPARRISHVVENLIVNKEGSDPGHRVLHAGRDPASDREHADRARPGVPHQLLGPHGPAGPPRPPPAARATPPTRNTPAASLVADQRRRRRPGARAGRDHRLRASVRQRPRSGRHHAAAHPRVPVDVGARQGGLLRGARLRGRPMATRARSGTGCSTAASGCPRARAPTRWRTSPRCAGRSA